MGSIILLMLQFIAVTCVSIFILHTGNVPAHLYGKTKFGDNVDDEWFLISLLFELSKAFPETCVR